MCSALIATGLKLWFEWKIKYFSYIICEDNDFPGIIISAYSLSFFFKFLFLLKNSL